VAVLVSLALHLLLIEKYDVWNAFNTDTDRQLIQARLILNDQTTSKNNTETPRANTAENPEEPPNSAEKTEPAQAPEVVSEVLPAPASGDVDPLKELIAAPVEPVPVEPMPLEPVDATSQALDANAVEEPAMPEPYSAVETTFDVFMNDESTRVGTALIRYETLAESKYQLTWEVKATGLLGLVYPNLVQTSQGNVSDTGLQPQLYMYQFGNKADKTYEARFNWSDKMLTLKTAKGEKHSDVSDNAQDFLSFMYQFMFVPPLSNMQMTLTNGKKVAVYDYAFEGEETLKLPFGEIKTYHIKHAKTDSEDKTELWLAMDYQYLPVKIRKTEKDGTVIEQVATVLNARQPQKDATLTDSIPTETTP
jgi:hypothetical protein